MKKKIVSAVSLLLLIAGFSFAQETDITSYLKEIESGNAEQVLKVLPHLKKEHPNDPSVIFLDAVLTTNAEEALQKYFTIYKDHPRSRYADAALYRIFSFYFSMGLYDKAQKYLDLLKSEYPKSPYISYADRNIPQQDLDKVVIVNDSSKKDLSGEKKEVAAQENKKPVAVTKEKPVVKYFYVQAGAFLNYDNAKKLKSQFKAKGWEAIIYPKDVGGSILNIVAIGKFTTRKEAEKLLTDLKSDFGIDGRIVQK